MHTATICAYCIIWRVGERLKREIIERERERARARARERESERARARKRERERKGGFHLYFRDRNRGGEIVFPNESCFNAFSFF